MALRYVDKPSGYSPQQSEDWRKRFPAHSQPMDTAPMGSRPIRLFEPDGRARWGIYHCGAYREVQSFRDPHTGGYSIRMNGQLISNPTRWASS